jgi:CMP-N-acetylneuraminic acid synthetase
MKHITAVVPIRKGSQRVIDKNFKDFFNSKSLLELKIESLLQIKNIDDIVVNTDSEDAIKIAKKYGVSYYRREPYYASSVCSQSEFFFNLAETTDSEFIIHSPCTSPLVSINTYNTLIHNFLNSNNDSANTVNIVKEYLWLDGNPLNYNILDKKVPNSQDLPDVFKLTFGINMLSKKTMLDRKNVVGNNPMFHIVNAVEEIDIDTQFDFDLAQFMYQKIN